METKNNSAGDLEKKLAEDSEHMLPSEEGTENLDLYKLGLPYVREGLEELWRKLVYNNSQHPYSEAIVKGVYLVMEALSEHKTPEEALKSTKGLELTLFMAGLMVNTVYMLSTRGEEFAEYWNSLYLSPEKLEKTKGVVIPAIWNIT